MFVHKKLRSRYINWALFLPDIHLASTWANPRRTPGGPHVASKGAAFCLTELFPAGMVFWKGE
jgi:hypothetical protein